MSLFKKHSQNTLIIYLEWCNKIFLDLYENPHLRGDVLETAVLPHRE